MLIEIPEIKKREKKTLAFTNLWCVYTFDLGKYTVTYLTFIVNFSTLTFGFKNIQTNEPFGNEFVCIYRSLRKN